MAWRTFWRRHRLRRSAKNIRQPVLGLVLALPGDDSTIPYTSFGIGCFHFGANPETFDGSAAAHVEAVESWLNTVEAITNVHVVDPRISWFEKDLPFGLADGGQPLPAITRLRIDFDLRVEVEERKLHDPWRQHTEPLDVHVSIRQGSAVPVAFIVPRTSRQDPTWAVSETWHALRARIPPDAAFELDIRGPSPAPAAGVLVPLVEPSVASGALGGFEYERMQLGVGDPWCVFAYNPEHHTHASAERALFDELEVPAGLFYEVVGSGRRLDLEWHELQSTRNTLVNRKRARGVFGRIARNWGEAALLRELAIALTEFEANVEASELFFGERRQELEELSQTPFLWDEIDEQTREAHHFSTARVARPLDLFEQRRMNRTQVLAMLMSAILAAAIGATSALWVSGSDQPPQVTVTVVSPASAPALRTPGGSGPKTPARRSRETRPSARTP
jgi:hypothetical protein